MITYLACSCGEIHPSALRERETGYVCGNCEARDEGTLRIGTCSNCKKRLPLHKHHKDGKRVSPEIEPWCVNCHYKLHRGQAIEDR